MAVPQSSTRQRCAKILSAWADSEGLHMTACSRFSVVERDGVAYCRQHDPEYLLRRQRDKDEARGAAAETAREVSRLTEAKADRDRAFVEACEAFMADGKATPERAEALARVLCANIIRAEALYDRAVKS